MGDDKIGGLDQRIERCDVELLAGHHRVGDARKPGGLRRYRRRGVAQAAIDADDIADHAGLVIGEGHRADLDHLVPHVAEARRLGIDQHRKVGIPALVVGRHRARHKLAQHPVVAALLQAPCRPLCIPGVTIENSDGLSLPRRGARHLPIARGIVE